MFLKCTNRNAMFSMQQTDCKNPSKKRVDLYYLEMAAFYDNNKKIKITYANFI